MSNKTTILAALSVLALAALPAYADSTPVPAKKPSASAPQHKPGHPDCAGMQQGDMPMHGKMMKGKMKGKAGMGGHANMGKSAQSKCMGDKMKGAGTGKSSDMPMPEHDHK